MLTGSSYTRLAKHSKLHALLLLAASAALASDRTAAESPAAPPTENPAAAASPTAPDDAGLRLIDEAGRSHEIAAAALAKLARTKVNVKVHDQPAEFEGVALADALSLYGVQFGKALKGQRAPTVILAEAADGYRVAIALLEIDADTTDKKVLLVDRRDGQPLSAEEGPYRLVLPEEKQPIRWIRMLRTLRILNLQHGPLEARPSATHAPPADEPPG